LVGAFGVGRITLELCDLITNTGGVRSAGALSTPLVRGAELGTFHLGSTVVIVAEPGRLRLDVKALDRVRVGASVARGIPRLEG
jgi:phosphatidylserine decarboxylase